jgi:hypothetical protein
MTGFHPHPDVLARRVGEEAVLVHMGRNEIFALNPTGARLWELLSEGRSRSEAVDQLKIEFDANEETVEREADRFLALLEREGLVEFEERP